MRLIQTGTLSALAVVLGMTASNANAQDVRVRADAGVGVTQFSAAGDHDSHVGWGGAAGVDFDLGGFVIGGEGTFWWAPAEVHTIDGPGLVDHKTFQEYGIAARLGYKVTPSTLVYGKVGYVWNEQRKRFTPINPLNDLPDSSLPGGYYDHFTTHGIQWGAGVEQMVSGPFYVKAEGRYSDYKNHTHALTARFEKSMSCWSFSRAAPLWIAARAISIPSPSVAARSAT